VLQTATATKICWLKMGAMMPARCFGIHCSKLTRVPMPKNRSLKCEAEIDWKSAGT
jgi:hypothetical protein